MEDLEIHDTGDEKQYRFRPFCGNTLRFEVKAAHDCHIAFTTGEEETDPMVQVFIGAWDGEASAIRWGSGDDLIKEDTEGILSDDEFREFWITKDNGEVRVGKGGDHAPFLSAHLPGALEATHFGFSTGYGATGAFRFCHERTLKTEDKLEYAFEPLYGRSATFAVGCGNDAHVCFTTGPAEEAPMYEVFIGGWENQSSAIRKNKEVTVVKVDTPDECCEGAKTYWVDISGGHVKVGRHGEAPFLEWEDPEPFTPTHWGYCTGWGAEGTWKLDC